MVGARPLLEALAAVRSLDVALAEKELGPSDVPECSLEAVVLEVAMVADHMVVAEIVEVVAAYEAVVDHQDPC